MIGHRRGEKRIVPDRYNPYPQNPGSSRTASRMQASQSFSPALFGIGSLDPLHAELADVIRNERVVAATRD